MSYAKDCPFCGSNESHYEWITTNIVVIQCDDCNAHGTTAYTEDDALDAWNQRPYDYDMPAIVKKVQRLETQVTALLVLLDGFRNADPYIEFSQAWQDANKANLLGFLSCKQPE